MMLGFGRKFKLGGNLGDVLLVVCRLGDRYLFRSGGVGSGDGAYVCDMLGVSDSLVEQESAVRLHIKDTLGCVVLGMNFSLQVYGMNPLLNGSIRVCEVGVVGVELDGWELLDVGRMERSRWENCFFDLILREKGM